MHLAFYGILRPRIPLEASLAWSGDAFPSLGKEAFFMASRTQRRVGCQVQKYRQRLAGSSQFPITQLLSAADVEQAVAAQGQLQLPILICQGLMATRSSI